MAGAAARDWRKASETPTRLCHTGDEQLFFRGANLRTLAEDQLKNCSNVIKYPAGLLSNSVGHILVEPNLALYEATLTGESETTKKTKTSAF